MSGRRRHPPHPRGRRPGARTLAAVAALASLPLGSVAHGDETPLVFAQPVYDELPASYFPTTLLVTELDGDGVPDLVVPGRDPEHRLLTLRGVGNGRFEILQELATEGFVDDAALGDLDGDGVEDLVLCWKGGVPRVVLHRGAAGGVFGEAEILAELGRDPQSVALADFDGDGDLDIAVCAYVSADIVVLHNDGSGTVAFSSRVGVGRFLGGYAYPRVVEIGDIDQDGDADILAIEVGGSRLAVLRNETGASGAGRFVRAVEYRAPMIGAERPGTSDLVVTDVDGDGDLDAVVPALLLEGAQKVIAFLNDGSGGFAERIVGEGSPLGYSFSLAVADLDGDGDLDVASGAALPGLVSIARRTDGGVLDLVPEPLLPFGQLPRALVFVDVDGDCDLDLVGVEGPARAVFTCLNETPQANSGGGVAAVRRNAGRRPVPQPGTPPAVGDVNGDGVSDAADLAVWLGRTVGGLPPVGRPKGVR